MPLRPYHAFIDESGQRAITKASSDHFVMSAIVVGGHNRAAMAAFLARLRRDLGRQPDQKLHWKNLRPDGLRLAAASSLGEVRFMRVLSVVVCKRHLPRLAQEDLAYMFTFRLLLERLSWLARGQRALLSYTLAHVQRFKLSHLREYEHRLQRLNTTIRWEHLDPTGGAIDQPKRVEGLQLADIAASATAAAFEPVGAGAAPDRRFLVKLAPALWRQPGSGQLISYGLKMHPWNDATRGAYSWVLEL